MIRGALHFRYSAGPLRQYRWPSMSAIADAGLSQARVKRVAKAAT